MVRRKVVNMACNEDHEHELDDGCEHTHSHGNDPHPHSNDNTNQNDDIATKNRLLPVPNPMPSYWLNEPHRYANLRSTPKLPERCDMAIIGSGMAGVLTCYHILSDWRKQQEEATLSKNNTKPPPMPSILLLDARNLCSGATARNGGHSKVKTSTLTGLSSASERNAFQAYARSNMLALKTLVDREGLAETCEFELGRSFDVFLDREEFLGVKRVYDDDLAKGEEWTRYVSVVPEEWVESVTQVRRAKGAFSVEAAGFWPYRVVTRVVEGMVGRYGVVREEGEGGGLNVQMNTPVTHVSSSDEQGGAAEQGETVLHTLRGNIVAQKVVFATNAYTAGLVPSFTDIITPYKGMNSHHTPSSTPTPTSSYGYQKAAFPHLNHTYNIHFGPSLGTDYLNPRPNGSLVAGGGSWLFKEQTSLWYKNIDDSVKTGHFPQSVYEHWEGYVERTFLSPASSASGNTHDTQESRTSQSSSKSSPESVWVGIQASTPDGLPHIGHVLGRRRQWVFAGFNGGGMSFIPGASRAVAKMVALDLGFGHVKGEFGLLEGMGTGEERMRKGDERQMRT